MSYKSTVRLLIIVAALWGWHCWPGWPVNLSSQLVSNFVYGGLLELFLEINVWIKQNSELKGDKTLGRSERNYRVWWSFSVFFHCDLISLLHSGDFRTDFNNVRLGNLKMTKQLMRLKKKKKRLIKTTEGLTEKEFRSQRRWKWCPCFTITSVFTFNLK